MVGVRVRVMVRVRDRVRVRVRVRVKLLEYTSRCSSCMQVMRAINIGESSIIVV